MKKTLVIVAHPDDETIWMGGTLLKNKSWNTTIASLCRKNDVDRAPKFFKVCEIYNATGIMADLEDENLSPINIEKIEKLIISLVKENEYDHIFTHGENGEYGHIRHKEVHLAVKNLVKIKKLKCQKLFFFNYETKNKKIILPSSIDKFIKLENSVFQKKKNIIENVYGFQKGSFEEESCKEAETFKILI